VGRARSSAQSLKHGQTLSLHHHQPTTNTNTQRPTTNNQQHEPTTTPTHRYAKPEDRARYADWTSAECRLRECLEVHATAGLEVDLEAVEGLLARKLPGVLRGEAVEVLREPWPSGDG